MPKNTALKVVKPPDKGKGIDDRKIKGTLPSGRKSSPSSNVTYGFDGQFKVVTPDYIKQIIPIIRSLVKSNPDVGQALHNIVSLGNTGHRIFFDRKVPTEQVDEMRNHLINKRKDWATGAAGMDGLVNKMISQAMIGGAVSNEWVPNLQLNGLESCILVNPEEIEFKLKKGSTKYESYQNPKNSFMGIEKSKDPENLIKLNPNTYRYFALNGDEEIPYGFPPYMSVLPRVSTQVNMDKNINFVVDQMGLIGFLEVLIQKPDQDSGNSPDDPAGESDEKYSARLTNLLEEAKTRTLAGFKDGVVAGFKDDHEFNFNSASKTFEDVVALYENNELMLASGLKQDASLMGRAYSSSETQMSIIFMKLLSELKNIQNLVKNNLEFGYALELRLAGFIFDTLEVRFNRSTIQDDLKYQQAEEIKIRNVKDKMVLGIIDQDQAADELGYEVPAHPEPMVSWEVVAGGSDPKEEGLETDKTKKKADTKKKKTASDKKVRSKNKPVPKVNK